MSTKLFDLRKQREAVINSADAIVTTAEKESNRALTVEENTKVKKFLATSDDLTSEIKKIESVNTLAGMVDKESGLPKWWHNPDAAHRAGKPNQQPFPEIDRFIRAGETSPAISAALSENDGLSAVVPAYQLEAFRLAVPFIAPFEAAGATIFATNDFGMHAIKQPFVLPGATVTTYAENAGPSSVTDASVVGITLNPAKYAFLTKISGRVRRRYSGA